MNVTFMTQLYITVNETLEWSISLEVLMIKCVRIIERTRNKKKGITEMF